VVDASTDNMLTVMCIQNKLSILREAALRSRERLRQRDADQLSKGSETMNYYNDEGTDHPSQIDI